MLVRFLVSRYSLVDFGLAQRYDPVEVKAKQESSSRQRKLFKTPRKKRSRHQETTTTTAASVCNEQKLDSVMGKKQDENSFEKENCDASNQATAAPSSFKELQNMGTGENHQDTTKKRRVSNCGGKVEAGKERSAATHKENTQGKVGGDIVGTHNFKHQRNVSGFHFK